MSEDKNKGALLPISGIAIILTAIGFTLFNQTPYKATRPSVPELREPYDKVFARLWQDPFRAIVDDARAHDKSRSRGGGAGQFGILDEKRNGRLTTDSLPNQIVSQSKVGQVTILGIMVFGGPYAEEAESRTRQRYAALSGLSRLKFVPEDPDHIDYITIADNRYQKGDKPSLVNIMPFEWLTYRGEGNNKGSVLLLWINEDVFYGTPLLKLARLKKWLGSAKQNTANSTRVKIIGPAGSTTLQEMVEEAEGYGKGKAVQYNALAGVEIYSAMATVDDKLLLGSVAGREKAHPKNLSSYMTNKFKEMKPGISFERTIGSDRKLAEITLAELKNRLFNSGSESNKSSKVHVVLVGEWDTYYGQSLSRVFKELLAKWPTPNAPVRVHRISYMRGIDGNIPGEKEEKKDDRPAQNSKSEENVKQLEQPTGKSQYDYLRRLAEEMYRFDQALKIKDERIKAIGILGNDFYDKYLALQALKQRFPEAIFFTTDLDARLMHPAHIEWTRNLIVASNFDLSLRKDQKLDIQGEIPPFRDNYQTALFFAILRMFANDGDLGEEESKYIRRPIEPRIFEIGRNRAISLIDWTIDDAQPERPRPEVNKLAICIIWLILFMLAFVWLAWERFRGFINTVFFSGVRNRVIAYVLIALLITVGCLYYWHILHSPTEEPFSFFEGISIWPTELFRVVAVILSLSFLRIAWLRLRSNRTAIEGEFGLDPSKITNLSKPWWWYIIRWNGQDPDDECMDKLWAEYVRSDAGRFRSLRMFLMIFVYFGICGFIIYIFGLPVRPVRGSVSILFDKWILAVSVVAFVGLIFYVFDVTRVCRKFITAISKGGPDWPDDSRKKFVEITEGTTHQKREAEGEKADPVEDGEPNTRVNEGKNSKEGGKTDPVGEWMLVHLIAKRTAAVGTLIFYPFIVWFVMFFSRIKYFDNWQTPVGLAIVISLGAMLPWSCAFLLRIAAEDLRAASIHRLKEEYIRIVSNKNRDENRIKQIDFVLAEISSIREGAFAPFLKHPVLQSLIVPFGGVGGSYLFEFLTGI